MGDGKAVISRPRDAFDAVNAPFREISEVMRASANQFSLLEKQLQKERNSLEKAAREQRIMGFSSSAFPGGIDDNSFEYLLASQPEESEYSNTIGLLFKVQDILWNSYSSLVGKVQVNEDEEVEHLLTALAHPKKIQALVLYNTFFNSEEYEKEDIEQKRENALAELEALRETAGSFRTTVEALSSQFRLAEDIGEKIYEALKTQHAAMVQRHQKNGQRIIKSPSLTSIAELIYDKLPGIEDIDEHILLKNISHYKIKSAARFLAYLTSPEIFPFVCDANLISTYAIQEMKKMHACLEIMRPLATDYKRQHAQIMEKGEYQMNQQDHVSSIVEIVEKVREIDFKDISFQRPEKKPSRLDLFIGNLRNSAYEFIINSLEELAKIKLPKNRKCSGQELKKYHDIRFKAAAKVAYSLLERRAKDNELEEQEKTAYRCLAVSDEESLGSIQIEPMDPPRTVSIERIKGSGFREVKEHFKSIDRDSRKYSAVAKVLSGKSNERNHFMLWGPPGVGKTEIMRTIPHNKNWIYIEARGADLGTAWMNETEKNPRRLFDLAYDKHCRTRKPVFVAIDEGEHLLAKVYGDYGAKTHNQVVAEIQALLDGTIAYEGVILLVSLNKIDHIQEAMMRRYHIFIVGELNADDRASLLYDFAGRGLPRDETLTLESCYDLGNRMTGAGGDLLRKPIDLLEKKFLKEMDEHYPKVLAGLETYLRDESGEFELSKVTPEEREYVKGEFAKGGYTVTPLLISQAVNKIMSDGSVRNLIKQTQDFYRDAKRKKRQMPGAEALEL